MRIASATTSGVIRDDTALDRESLANEEALRGRRRSCPRRMPALTLSETVTTAALTRGPSSFRRGAISSIVIALSIAFAMSYTVSAATETAVSASISTPVCAVVSAEASISTAPSTTESVNGDVRQWQRVAEWNEICRSLRGHDPCELRGDERVALSEAPSAPRRSREPSEHGRARQLAGGPSASTRRRPC